MKWQPVEQRAGILCVRIIFLNQDKDVATQASAVSQSQGFCYHIQTERFISDRVFAPATRPMWLS